ncbi:MAG: hypothetical protein JXR34_13795 [Bacteroidales bacterium]|nr:hypothetical protein [Bacteroidales bacterium]
MSIIQFIRLIQKNIWILLGVPVLLAVLVWYFTRNEEKVYVSSTVVYTGIASGMNIESQEPRNVDFFGVKIIFDNFINIVESRETKEETGIELFAQNLMLPQANREYIAPHHFNELQRITPKAIKNLIRPNNLEATKEAMLDYMRTDDTNFLYRLLNLDHPHYSVKAISKVKVTRINNSDLLKIEYSNNDPGITKQTLVILTRVFIKKYKALQRGQSSDVVKYFMEQVALATERLKDAEDRLLEFNQNNNIINYYEQSKYIAAQKEELGVKIQNIRMDLVAAEAAVQELESKLNKKELIKLNSQNIVKLRNELSSLSAEETLLSTTNKSGNNDKKLAALNNRKANLKKDLEAEIQNLSLISASKEGLPIQKILSSWLSNVVKLEETKSQLSILNERKMEFEQTYQKFAPLGATMKRIEREIDVAERAYLELLHSLTLAKLKQQNIELSSSVEIVDEPYFPITAQASKRKVLIIAAGLIGGLFTLALIIILEYFDSTIRTPERAMRFTGFPLAGVFPRLNAIPKKVNAEYLRRRMLEMIARSILYGLSERKKPQIIAIVSTQRTEGKTMMAKELAVHFTNHDSKVLVISQLTDIPDSEFPFDLRFFNVDKPISINETIEDAIGECCNLPEYDYIFLDIPSLIYFESPDHLIQKSDLLLFILRSNRNWTKADENSLDFLKTIHPDRNYVILNGIDIDTISEVLGEIPKQRSRIRRILKKLITFNYRSRSGF